MAKSNEIRGIEIYNFSGKKVGSVLYPLWKCKNKKLDGLVVLKSNFLQIKFFLPYTSVDRFEDGRIYLIKNYKTRKTEIDIQHIKAVIKGKNAFVSKYTFDEKTGSVKSVEIAKNIYEDIRQKRKEYENFSVKDGLVIIN